MREQGLWKTPLNAYIDIEKYTLNAYIAIEKYTLNAYIIFVKNTPFYAFLGIFSDHIFHPTTPFNAFCLQKMRARILTNKIRYMYIFGIYVQTNVL